MIKRGDDITLSVESAAFEGKTVSRIDGFVVFVEGAVPGDIVRARITSVKQSFAEAKVLHVVQPSQLRTEPRCRYFGTCGGCKWQHVEYHAQLQFKQQQVVDAFERIGGFQKLPILPIIGAEEVYFYRNKMEFSFSDQQWIVSPAPASESDRNVESETGNPELFLGLHVPQRYDKVLDIEECHLQSEVSNAIVNFTRSFARAHRLPVYSTKTETGYLRFLVIRQSSVGRKPVQQDESTRGLMVNLVTFEDRPDVMQQYTKELVAAVPAITTVVNTINSKKTQIAYGQVERLYHGEGIIHERLGKHLFTISASSFFQPNTAQAEKLYGVVKDFAELSLSDVVWDLYSGTGSIALFISDAAKEVVGIESAASAVKDAERNATLNNVRNCSFILGDLKERLTKETHWMSTHAKPDVMIIDPPRSGMHPKVVDEVCSLAPRRIVYVSCNPATQARDVKMLCAEHYELVKLQPVDMFPHTYHIENVALLIRR